MAKKTKKPASVVIFGKTVLVEYKPLYANKEEGDEVLSGKYNVNDRVITMDDSLEGAKFSHTLFHEMIHAALDIGGVGEVLDEKTEEAIAKTIENGLGEYFCL